MLDTNLGHLARLPAPAAGAGTLHPDQVLVIFDGTCGLCSDLAGWALRLDRWQGLAWLPSQTPGLLDATGLTPRDVSAAAWALLPDGELRRGAAAIAAAVDALVPGRLPWCATLQRLPGLRGASEAVYAWAARNRGRWPGHPVCDARPPAPLDDAIRWEIERRRERFCLA